MAIGDAAVHRGSDANGLWRGIAVSRKRGSDGGVAKGRAITGRRWPTAGTETMIGTGIVVASDPGRGTATTGRKSVVIKIVEIAGSERNANPSLRKARSRSRKNRLMVS